jgi:hypothetical protein
LQARERFYWTPNSFDEPFLHKKADRKQQLSPGPAKKIVGGYAPKPPYPEYRKQNSRNQNHSAEAANRKPM